MSINGHPMPTRLLSRTFLHLVLSALPLLGLAQGRTYHWSGGSGRWDDAANWSLTPGGPGGAGVPHAGDAVVVAPSTAVTIDIVGTRACGDLRIVPLRNGSVTVAGSPRAELELGGGWVMKGAVQWAFAGATRMGVRRQVADVDIGGVLLHGDVVIDGTGGWNLLTDLKLDGQHALVLKEGTLVTNGNHVVAGDLRFTGGGRKSLMAGGSVIEASRSFDAGGVRDAVEPGSSHLLVRGVETPWGTLAVRPADDFRGISVCGTGPGQTPFTINAQVLTNYNGYNVSCNGACDATVTVTIIGGVGPFAYTWATGPNTQTWTGTCVGNKLVIVTDLGQNIGCAATVQVLGPPPLGVIFFPAITPPTCAGVCNGTANAIAVGGTGSGYVYTWNNGAGSGTFFNQLCAGANNLSITDQNNCQFDTTFTINLLPVSPNLTFTNVTCNAACNGTATVAPSGGTGTYTYAWTPAPPVGQGTPNASGLCAGNWSVTVTDANGCTGTSSFVVTEPAPILASVLKTDVLCAGTCTGTATVTPSGGTGPYTFSWSPAPGGGQGTSTATGLCAGTYTVTVTDQPSGCSIQVPVTIAQPPALAVSSTVTNASCAGVCDGGVILVVTGGTGPYLYTWSPVPPLGQGTPSVSGLCAGTWSATVSDASGCDTTVQFTITAPPPLAPNGTVTNASCNGVCDGSIAVAVTGGTGAYTYSWSPNPPVGQGTANASQLCAGNWSLTVTDANGCDTTVQFIVLQPPPLTQTSTQTNVTCGTNCDGTATVTVSGGTPGYTYQWSPAPGGGQGTAVATGLCAGGHTVLVTDANGCTLSVPFTITAPVPLQLSLQTNPASCPGACDGSAGVIVTGGTPGYAYQWSPAPGGGQGTANATGLCAGAYQLTVTDAVGCDSTIAFTIAAPPPVLPNEVVTDAICPGSCNGSVVLNPTGGTGTYAYAWSPVPSNGQGTAQALGLCAGTVQVTITSGACDTTLTLTIDAPPPLAATLTTTGASCWNSCDGGASVTVSGGTPGYTYAWSPAPAGGQGTANATGLCPGPGSLTITDAAGCDTTITFTITAPAPIAPGLTVTNASCSGNCDGSAVAAVSGGTPGYTYAWSPAPGGGQGTANATGLCAGNYTLTITDAAGCDTTVSFSITAPPPLQISLQVVDASCPDVCDGTAGVIVTGGTGTYTYGWSPAPGGGQGTANVTGLCDGAYTLTVTDAAGCDSTISFTVGAPPPIVPNPTVDNTTCANGCDGSVVLSPTGGTGAYTYTWSPVPSNGQGTAQALGLCAGTVQVTIASGGCDTTLTFTITAPPPIDAVLTITNTTCWNGCDGSAGATVNGGTPGYTYAWSPAPGGGQGTPNATGLCAGTYALTITDASGCDTTITFTITAPAPIDPALTVQNASCGGSCDGQATVLPTGGTGGYVILWNPAPGGGQGTNTATGLCPGVYDVTITDAAGCDTTVQFTVVTPSGITSVPTVTPASCADVCDGAVSLSTSGGVPAYTFTWTPAPAIGQGTPSASGFCAGAVTVQIGDQAGCDTVFVVNVPAPAPVVPNGIFTNENCNGPCTGTASVAPTGGSGTYTYLWSPSPGAGQGTASVSGLCAGNWTCTITDAAGCDTVFAFTVLPEQPIDPGLVFADATCYDICNGTASVAPTGGAGGFSYLWTPTPPVGQGTPNVSDLCLGFWQITITDSVGCDTTASFIIVKPPPLVTNLEVFDETCAGPCSGAANVYPFGGTPGYAVVWSPAPGGGQGTNSATGLCQGTYQVTLSDLNGCDTTETFVVGAYTPLDASFTIDQETCSGSCDGAVVAVATGGQQPYGYTWSPAPASGQGTPSVSGLCAGAYDLTIFDAAFCDTTLSVVVPGPSPVDAQATVQNASCAGVCDGSIALSATGGTGTYTYTWSPAPGGGQGTANATGLCAGSWSVTVADANGCDTLLTFTITEPLPLANTVSVVPSQCQQCVGEITMNTTGGTGTITYTWGAPINLITVDPVQPGLCAGLYTVLIQDASGCSLAATVPVTDSNGEVLTMTDGSTSCPNTCDGAVAVSFNCGVPTCSVQWTDMNAVIQPSVADTLSGLCAGDYYVLVTNGDGCVSIDTATVISPVPVTAGISSTPVSCSGLCDGTATIGLSGGQPPFTITWSPAPGGGQGTPQATGLCPGVYDITVQDAGGCDTTYSVLILGPAPLQPNATVTPITCAGQCDAGIGLAPTGGSGAYSYTWSPVPPNGQGTASATGLCAGTWSVVLADANGCDTALTFVINAPQALAAAMSSNASQCQLCNGTADVTVTGGTAPYQIDWTDANGAVVGTGPSLINLCAGLYTATVTDSTGCSVQATAVISDSDGELLTPVDGQTLCANACDGQAGVSFICSNGPCAITWYDGQANLIASNVFTVTNLCTGDYYVQVVNGDGCVSIDTVTVAPSTLIIPNLSTTPASCAGVCDGTATTGPVGGVGPYTFTWAPQPGGGQGTPQATGLCPGTYSVTIADQSGCDTTVTVLILGPQPITATATVQNVTCNAACDGAISLIAQGGTGALTYLWSPAPGAGQGTASVSGLCAGGWNVLVADANGCDTTLTFTITEPAVLALTTGSTQSACGQCIGTAVATPVGGTAPYVYSWSQAGAVFSTDSLAIGLCAGLYSVTMTDANGCNVSTAVPVTDLDGELLSTTNGLTGCPGDCNGLVTVSFNCGIPVCSVAWFNAQNVDQNEPGNALDSLCAGTYFVQVTNGNGCVSIDTALVVDPPPIVANLSSTPVTCAGTCDGTATVAPTGGAGAYTYDWSPVPPLGQGTPQASGLCAGTYAVTITDSTGCAITQPVLILGPSPIAITATIDPITCNGACDGSIDVVVQGGVGGFTLLWSPQPTLGQGTASVDSLCAGTWDLLVTDANGCDTTASYTVVEPPVLQASLTTTDNLCFGDCLGTATAIVTGGVAPYGIQWTTSGGTPVAQDTLAVGGLCAGDLVFTVTDANGCAVSIPFTITQGLAINAGLTFTQETCFGPCDGTATVNPSGGAGGYSYSWTPQPGGGQGTPNATGLCPGTWSVTITDANGCDTTVTFTILPFTPIDPNAVVAPVTCNGACDGSITLNPTGGVGALVFTWTPVPPNGQGVSTATGLCAGTWDLTITDLVGCDTTLAFVISEPAALDIAVDAVTDASCATANDGAIAITVSGGTPGYTIGWTGPGFTSAQEDITGLLPGLYIATVFDANGCSTTLPVTVNALITVVADAGPDLSLCEQVAIVLDGSTSTGGTTYTWANWTGTVIGSGPTLNVGTLPAGSYIFTLTASDGPCSDVDSVLVTVLALPIADAGPDRTIIGGGEVQLGGSPSGPPGSSFAWEPDSLFADATVPNPEISIASTQLFTLSVVAPNGCTDTSDVLITVVPEIDIPSGFTPNGDGWNDTWVISLITLFPDCEVEIYNRWGELLFRSVGYGQPWDGRYKGGFVPVGTYYYVIELNDPKFPEPYTGPLTVIR